MRKVLPKEYDPKAIEPKWQEFWEREGIYRFDWSDEERPVFSLSLIHISEPTRPY